jgi:hypothetical protein
MNQPCRAKVFIPGQWLRDSAVAAAARGHFQAGGFVKNPSARKAKTPSKSITWGYALEETEGFEPSMEF